MHTYGTEHQKTKEKLTWLQEQIDDVYNHANKNYDKVSLHIFSDHGMCDTVGTIDLISIVEKADLVYGKDYVAMYDSTMARFWFMNEEAKEEIEKIPEKNLHKSTWMDALLSKFTGGAKSKYNDEIRNLELGLKILILTSIFLGVLCFTLVSKLIDVSDNKIITVEILQEAPSGVYKIGPNWATRNYHEMFAKSIILDKTNFNFTNFESKMNDLMSFTLPDLYDQSYVKIKDNKKTRKFLNKR